MSRLTTRLLALALLAVLAAPLLAPPSTPAQGAPIKIGFLAPMSGAFAQVGKDMLNGTELYLDEIGRQVAGRKIDTIEGVAKGQSLHPIQQKFLEHAALQCGICTPGFIVASKALLERNPNPTDTEIRYWLAGNLCRCTGYDKIVSAVKDAAVAMRKG